MKTRNPGGALFGHFIPYNRLAEGTKNVISTRLQHDVGDLKGKRRAGAQAVSMVMMPQSAAQSKGP
jgi:hypothetical protein